MGVFPELTCLWHIVLHIKRIKAVSSASSSASDLSRYELDVCSGGTLVPSYRKASHSGSRMSLGRLSTNTTRNQLKLMRDTSMLWSSKWAANRGSFSARKSFSTRWSAWAQTQSINQYSLVLLHLCCVDFILNFARSCSFFRRFILKINSINLISLSLMMHLYQEEKMGNKLQTHST